MCNLAIFHLFKGIGGSTLVALAFGLAGNLMGCHVEYYVFNHKDIENFNISKRIFNINVKARLRIIGIPKLVHLLETLNLKLAKLRAISLVRHAEKVMERLRSENMVVIDTFSNIPTNSDVVYIHYPLDLQGKYNSPYYRFYNVIISRISNRLINHPKNVLTNSSWTARKIQQVYSIEPEILHPPVDVDEWNRAYTGSHSEKAVVTISRFSPLKNLESVLYVASKLRSLTFYLCGIATTQQEKKTLHRLIKLKEKMKLRNVYFIINASRDTLIDIASSAKFYLHPLYSEHFGISVAEAAAAGLIPFVYYDSGSCTDIASKIHPFLCYRNIADAVKKLMILLSSKSLEDDIRKRAHSYVQRFSLKRFLERVENLLIKINNIKV